MHSVDPAILYSRYGYRSSTNATMRAHLTKIALDTDALRMKNNLRVDSGPSCLDVGCNDGFLSRQLPTTYPKVGIDPCDIGKSIEGIPNFRFVNDIFPSAKLGKSTFDIITMIACFYDLNDPVTVATALCDRLKASGILVVEVSYWPTKMAQNALDEICQEHVCFYNFQNLEAIFYKAGLTIFNVEKNNINGGSIQVWLCRADSPVNYSTPDFQKNIMLVKFDEMDQRLDTPAPYNYFRGRCEKLKYEIRSLFKKIQGEGKTVHLYGASTKGNVLLQYLDLNSKDIPYAAERSKEKHGGATLGTGIKMISEEDSRAMRPDYYFVPIWSFRDEVIRREQTFIESGGKLIFPLPKLEIIGK